METKCSLCALLTGSYAGAIDYFLHDLPRHDGHDLHYNIGEEMNVVWNRTGEYSTTMFGEQARYVVEEHDPEKVSVLVIVLMCVFKHIRHFEPFR